MHNLHCFLILTNQMKLVNKIIVWQTLAFENAKNARIRLLEQRKILESLFQLVKKWFLCLAIKTLSSLENWWWCYFIRLFHIRHAMVWRSESSQKIGSYLSISQQWRSHRRDISREIVQTYSSWYDQCMSVVRLIMRKHYSVRFRLGWTKNHRSRSYAIIRINWDR